MTGWTSLRRGTNYLSEEFPELVGSGYNDFFRAEGRLPDGTLASLATEEVKSHGVTPISGVGFPGGDDTVGQSGWQSVSVTIDAADLNGPGALELIISDVGDAIYDSVALIDDVEIH